jgi:hypothetical protein
LTEANGTSGSDLYSPEVDSDSSIVKDPLEEVGFTHGSTPDRDQHVCAAGSFDVTAHILWVVLGDT